MWKISALATTLTITVVSARCELSAQYPSWDTINQKETMRKIVTSRHVRLNDFVNKS